MLHTKYCYRNVQLNLAGLVKRFLLFTAILFIFFCGIDKTQAQTYGSASHTITVVVNTITMVSVSASSVSMTITGTGAIAGQDQMTVTNSSTSLLWGVNSSLKKITAQTNLGAPLFAMNLLAASPTAGTAAPEITLSATPTDLLTNIGRSLGSCTLQYTGVALASQGTGTDSHTITFTIAA
ncbi:MAG: hypothetical protein HY089_08415, partial [Ignavibacteriales bacterium]|nr:hypothetical protein [Ignavibacteriales bacterium]